MNKQQEQSNHLRCNVATLLSRDIVTLRRCAFWPLSQGAINRKAKAIRKLANSIINENNRERALATITFESSC